MTGVAMTGEGMWRKSTYSGGENNACVEVSRTFTAVRDSKRPDAAVLAIDVRGLIKAVKSGQFEG